MNVTTEQLEAIGFRPDGFNPGEEKQLIEYINLKLSALGQPIFGDEADYPFLKIGQSLLASLREKNRLLSDHLCPADAHITRFLREYLGDEVDADEPLLPTSPLMLDRHGMARVLSLPPDKDEFHSNIISSYRVFQGVLHNPEKDRRTTKGVFHVADGGFPVPADKKEVPRGVYANLLRAAIRPPRELMRLPFTSSQEEKAEVFVSHMLRPKLMPEVEGFTERKSIEVRFFVPGNLVANLDFVESIFGNAGDPFLPENDARLDADHWSGHTGCVILAPQLLQLTKKELGLPHVDDATERQKKDGMCWSDPEEKYNDGSAFKLTARDHRGVVVTLIADNYFGYCKKEVKTMLSYSANLFGLAEEEHAGGAIAFPRYDLGEEFQLSQFRRQVDHTFEDLVAEYGDLMDLHEPGYGVDKQYKNILYVPHDVHIDLRTQRITWERDGKSCEIKLLPKRTYVLPSGYKVEMGRLSKTLRWRLIGTTAEGTLCHKPCTVSGGGKSEISKPITDAMFRGPVVVGDFKEDFDLLEEIVQRDYANRFQFPREPGKPSRPFLSSERSLGSVVRLLTPSVEHTEEYNAWLGQIPRRVRDLALLLKRFYHPNWGDNWRERFSVDRINGKPGNELKYLKKRLQTSYIRVGFEDEGSWRTFSLRKDFLPSEKLQVEDDITASVVVPTRSVEGLYKPGDRLSQKFLENVEYRLFQRPDEAIVRGYDKTAEMDFSRKGNFFSNYEPLAHAQATDMVEDAIAFDQFSRPIQKVIGSYVKAGKPDYLVSTSHPRLMDGVPTKNPRYLQNRPDLGNTRPWYLAELGARLHRRIPLGKSVPFPVDAVIAGRRNNPADHEAGIRPLAVYNPVHYQELPELFMEFISSLTGKSPSTTGAGSEGAMTKGPFNALPPIIDVNNALVSYLLTGHGGFTSSAGYIGPNHRVDHDISLVIPEVWSRMTPQEREHEYLIKEGFLELVEDFEHEGKTVPASRLGYRINEKFVAYFFGRMFSNPATVFTEAMLRPEKQNMDDYVDGIDNIVTTQRRIAMNYFEDGSVEMACPPLKALLHIMAHGEYEGKDIHHPEIRALFTREFMLESEWYKERLVARREVEIRHARQQVAYLEAFLARKDYQTKVERLEIPTRLAKAQERLKQAEKESRVEELFGTLGTDPVVLGPR